MDAEKQGTKSPYATKFTPRMILSSHAAQMKLAYGIAALCLIIAAVSPWLLLKEMHSEENVMVLDGSGTIHVGPMERLSAGNKLFMEIAMQASQAMFERSKVGLESTEMVKALFSNNAIRKLNLDMQWQLPDIAAKDLREHATIEKITVVKDAGAGGARFYRVQGFINSAGMVNGSALAYTKPFVLRISFVPNKKMSDLGRYPFIVSDFSIDQPSRPANLGAEGAK